MSRNRKFLMLAFAALMGSFDNSASAQAPADALVTEFKSKGAEVVQMPGGTYIAILASSGKDRRTVAFCPISANAAGESVREVMWAEWLPAGVDVQGICKQMRDAHHLEPNLLKTKEGELVLTVTANLPPHIDANALAGASNSLHKIISGETPAPDAQLAQELAQEQLEQQLEQLRIEEQGLQSEVQICEDAYHNFQDDSEHSPSSLPSLYANSWYSQWKDAERRLRQVQREIARLERGR